MGIDGSEQRRIGSVTVNPRPSMWADDKWVYFTAADRHGFRIAIDGGEPMALKVSAPAGGPAAPLPDGFHDAVSSPDGRMFAGHYNSRERNALRCAARFVGHHMPVFAGARSFDLEGEPFFDGAVPVRS
jgi:hypothetical protein